MVATHQFPVAFANGTRSEMIEEECTLWKLCLAIEDWLEAHSFGRDDVMVSDSHRILRAGHRADGLHVIEEMDGRADPAIGAFNPCWPMSDQRTAMAALMVEVLVHS